MSVEGISAPSRTRRLSAPLSTMDIFNMNSCLFYVLGSNWDAKDADGIKCWFFMVCSSSERVEVENAVVCVDNPPNQTPATE
jgi:hypothetical protein